MGRIKYAGMVRHGRIIPTVCDPDPGSRDDEPSFMGQTGLRVYRAPQSARRACLIARPGNSDQHSLTVDENATLHEARECDRGARAPLGC